MGISVNDSKLAELVRLSVSWTGLVSGQAGALVQDSLVLLDHLVTARRLVDVGSGGGWPGLPLKIVVEILAVTLVEADQAKAAFLVHASASLGLAGVDVVARRAEDVGHDARYREAFDVAVARALSPMRTLVELCLPLVKVGGIVLAQKTREEEVAAARRAVDILRGAIRAFVPAPSVLRAAVTCAIV